LRFPPLDMLQLAYHGKVHRSRRNHLPHRHFVSCTIFLY
jgi:hypothetical protein